jgi:PAS domain S-box-containing protein
MYKNKKTITTILLVTILFLYGIFELVSFYKNNRINSILDTHTKRIQTFYEILDYNQKTTAQVAFQETMENQQFLTLFEEANNYKNNNEHKSLDILRKKAENLLEKKYQLYKEKGVLQYHFVFPDNTVFLRMHKTNKYGDNLNTIRSDFAYVNKNKKQIRGFAQGRTSHAFRNVYPVINKNGIHLGAVEISFSSDLLQRYFSNINKIHTHFLVRKDIFKSKAWSRDDLLLKYQPSAEHKNYMITLTGTHTVQQCIVENKKRLHENLELIDELVNKKQSFSVYTTKNKTPLVTSFYPIKHNISGEPVAWIVSYDPEPLINDAKFYSSLLLYLISFIVILVSFVIYYLLNQKQLLNSKIKEKTNDLVSSNKELKGKDKELQKFISELKASELFLTNIMESAIDGIVTIDEKGSIQTFNKAAIDLFGYSKEEILGQNVKILVPSPHHENHDQYLKNYIETGIKKAIGKTAKVKAKRKDGSTFPASIRIGEVVLENKRIFTALIQDDTEQKKYENALVEAKNIAEDAARAKSEFLANMSHEIRTPMNAIIGITFLLQQTKLNEKQYSYVNKVDNASKHLLGIINDVLDYSKIEAGKMELEYVEFNFHDILDSLSDMFTLKVKDKDLELLFNIDNDLPFNLIGDQLRLSQILINIIGNAIKFTDKGLIVLNVTLLEQKEKSVHLEFGIEDTGIGMSSEQVEKIFSTYSQADSSTTRKFGGSGLGLTISQYLVGRMGGEIKVSSSENKGSEFTFDISLDMQEEQTTFKIPQEDTLNVLIVDDNPIALEITTSILESFGYTTTSVENGTDAVGKLQNSFNNNKPYDLVVIDYKMPNMDGIDTLEMIHKEFTHQTLPKVIMLSSTDIHILQNSLEKNRVDQFLSKPFTQSHLYDLILQIFHKDQLHLRQMGISKSESYKDHIQTISGAHLLLVEDNLQNQEIAIEYLKKANITCDIANDGKEALEMLNSSYDGVLMDCQMPVMDGYEATGNIRALSDENLKKISIIAMTANAMQGDRQRCIVSGMDDYISKPIDITKMFKTLSKWIKPQNPNSLLDEDETQEKQTLSYDALGLDTHESIMRMGGDEKLYLKQLEQFKSYQTQFMSQIDEALEKQDLESLIRAVHTLKGLAGNIGAKELQHKSKELENDLKSNGITNTTQDASYEIIQDITLLEEKLDQFFTTFRSDEESGEILDEEAFLTSTQELKTYLEEFDAESMDLFEKLKPTLATKISKEKLTELEELIQNLEFDSALEILKDL